MADKEVCRRCGRKTASKSIEFFRGRAYGRGCLEYCNKMAEQRAVGANAALKCIVCGVTVAINDSQCNSGLCCHCCLSGPKYCAKQ